MNTAIDPTFAAIEQGRATWLHCGEVLRANDPDWSNDVCRDAEDAMDDAHELAFKTVPTTAAGAAALAAYAIECARRDGGTPAGIRTHAAGPADVSAVLKLPFRAEMTAP